MVALSRRRSHFFFISFFFFSDSERFRRVGTLGKVIILFVKAHSSSTILFNIYTQGNCFSFRLISLSFLFGHGNLDRFLFRGICHTLRTYVNSTKKTSKKLYDNDVSASE